MLTRRGALGDARNRATREAVRQRAAVARDVSRFVGDSLTRRMATLAGIPDSSGTVPLTAPFEARAGAGTLRPLLLGDGSSWTRNRRLNAEHMSAWWEGSHRWQGATDERAFQSHFVAWEIKRRRGAGMLLALVRDDEVVGEFTYTSQHNGLSVGLGMWALPRVMAQAEFRAVIGASFDELLFGRGVVRLEAPVAAGNANPVRLLTFAGFLKEGTMAQSRPLGGVMVDHDLYGLTRDMWLASREIPYSLAPWPVTARIQNALDHTAAARRGFP